MKRLIVFVAIAILIFLVQLAYAEDYRVIRKISLPSHHHLGSDRLIIFPDGSKVAYTPNKGGILNKYGVVKGGKWFVMVNDEKVSAEFDNIRNLTFSTDGSTVAYGVQRGGKWSFWINERKVSPEFDHISWSDFSPDCSKVAYVVEIVEKESIWVNDRRVYPEFDVIDFPTFSPDGSKVAYEANEGGKKDKYGITRSGRWSIWINDRRASFEFDDVGIPKFSPDGNKVAYSAKSGNKWSVWINDERTSPEFDNVSFLTFSPDGTKVAYVVKSRTKSAVWINYKRVSPEFEGFLGLGCVELPTFNADGSKIAYAVESSGKHSIWINDRKVSPDFDTSYLAPYLSPNGSKVAYKVAKRDGDVYKHSIWINDRKVTPEFDDITFAKEHFKKTGEIIFAGYDKERYEILHAVSLVELKGPLAGELDAGKKAPVFTLNSFDGQTISLSEYKGKIVVLEWFNFECPFSRYHYGKANTMVKLANKYKDKNVVWLAVNSTTHTTIDKNREFAQKYKLPFPILDDRSGKVGRAYGATHTPHMFIIDTKGNIVYEGAIDNSPIGRTPAREKLINYVDKALAELTTGKVVSIPKTKPYGFTVKYGKAVRSDYGETQRTAKNLTVTEEVAGQLPEILKEDLALKEKRDNLLRKIRAAGESDEKKELIEQLEEVVGNRFGLIIRRKQIAYEQLRQKLEELKKQVEQYETKVNVGPEPIEYEQLRQKLDELRKSVEQHKAELNKWKQTKDKQVKKRVEELIGLIPTQGYVPIEKEGFYAGKVIDCKAGKSITIEDPDNNILTFKIAEATIHSWKECDERGPVWLEAKGDTARYISELPEGVTLQQIERRIEDIRQKAIGNIREQGKRVHEPVIIYESWKIASKEYEANPDNMALRKVRTYFWRWMLRFMQ